MGPTMSSGEQSLPLPGTPRAQPAESSALSFAQSRMWFFAQLEPGSVLYNTRQVLRLVGPLDVDILERSLGEIVRRHEVLRACFPVVDGTPRQMVAPAGSFRLPMVDLTCLPAAAREERARRWAMDESSRVFDLARGPILRGVLLRLDEQEHLLALVIHHIAFDGWSAQVFFRELVELYSAFAHGSASPLPAPPLQFGDYAEWQRHHLQGELLERELVYWKKRLRDAPPVLELPTDRPRPPAQSYRGGRRGFTLGGDVLVGLNALGRQEGATRFMTLLAAFQALLWRYTGQTDLVVGVPVAGRTRLEVEGLIGCFANTLVLRTDLSGDPTFKELLKRVRNLALEDYTHQELPFEKLVEELHPERSLRHHRLFQVMFNYRSFLRGPVGLPGLQFERVDLYLDVALVDLSLNVEQRPSSLTCWMSYNEDLFDAETIERMVGHFQALLAGVVAGPNRRLSAVPLLSPAERQQLIIDWNDTEVRQPEEQCVHQRFEAQAERSPDAVAVVFEERHLSYQQLNRRANQLAHYLQKLGVGPEVVVGVCVERSLELAVALLAVLKAGGAYLPLDPAYPRARLALMLEDAAATVVLTQRRFVAGLRAQGARVVDLDAEWVDIAAEQQGNPMPGVAADNLAYVIYTSGSTGRPKGVMVSHRAIGNHLSWRQAHFPLTPADRSLHKASISFDDSVWEILEPLVSGAQLIVARPQGHQDPAYLVRLISELKITAACFVPSLLQVFLNEDGVETCDCLRRVTTGGETLPPELLEPFFARLDADLHNGYGPTETTIAATFWHCSREAGRDSILIGRPIANTTIYVLDSHLQPVPVGVPGEMYIGGVGLARGYLRRPQLTAEVFIPDSFGDTAGARLYRTGDLARYRPDGNLEFLGRIDSQVKLRGCRVEPGEVEAMLRLNPAVHAAAVTVFEDPTRDKRLVAYVVPRVGSPFAIAELRDFLTQRLPDYMVPAAFVRLDALPLLPNGKVERGALPPPDQGSPTPDFAAPQTRTEVLLAGIWADVLGLERIGRDDNFFGLGGHSLLATQVISRVRAALHAEVPLRALFEAPTVSGFARTVNRQSTM